MADGDLQASSNPRGGRGPRDGAGREPGGFRIRLSDNEMRAARAVQEAFGLRSTVAALGLSIRTVAQLLEEGKLDDVLAQHRASGGERRGPRPERGERPSNRPNPFARPARPAAAAPAAVAEVEAAADSEPAADATSESSDSTTDASETASTDA